MQFQEDRIVLQIETDSTTKVLPIIFAPCFTLVLQLLIVYLYVLNTDQAKSHAY